MTKYQAHTNQLGATFSNDEHVSWACCDTSRPLANVAPINQYQSTINQAECVGPDLVSKSTKQHLYRLSQAKRYGFDLSPLTHHHNRQAKDTVTPRTESTELPQPLIFLSPKFGSSKASSHPSPTTASYCRQCSCFKKETTFALILSPPPPK